MRCFYDPDHQRSLLLVTLFLLVTGCASSPPRIINLMPAPDVYQENVLSPFADDLTADAAPYRGMLYATDRAPVDPETAKPSGDQFYSGERGQVMRLGIAQIELGEEAIDWEQAKAISLAKDRPDKYPLKVVGIDEIGIHHDSFHRFVNPNLLAQKSEEPARRFAELINQKLAISRKKDIFIYVPGYKVVFENPILVATELWHFLGYEGAFISFPWPSTPKRTAYFADAETTITSTYGFRLLLQYLAENTRAERINIVGYSQGTRLVMGTLHELALINNDQTREELQNKLRIGNVILIGSDIERQVFGRYLLDGLLKVPEHLTVYASEKDKALNLSKMIYGRSRMGQMFAAGELSETASAYLSETTMISLVNVTEAEGADSENGHRYFRNSPWASSDLLMTLRYDLLPDERGLVRSETSPVWTFPPDYITRLRNAITEAQPSTQQ